MSVLKSKRKPSQFEVFHHLNKLRKDITDLLLRDFGYSFEKAEARLLKQFGGGLWNSCLKPKESGMRKRSYAWKPLTIGSSTTSGKSL